jgi:hypothetical protein
VSKVRIPKARYLSPCIHLNKNFVRNFGATVNSFKRSPGRSAGERRERWIWWEISRARRHASLGWLGFMLCLSPSVTSPTQVHLDPVLQTAAGAASALQQHAFAARTVGPSRYMPRCSSPASAIHLVRATNISGPCSSTIIQWCRHSRHSPAPGRCREGGVSIFASDVRCVGSQSNRAGEKLEGGRTREGPARTPQPQRPGEAAAQDGIVQARRVAQGL